MLSVSIAPQATTKITKQCANCQTTFDLDTWQCPVCSFAPRMIQGYPAFAPDIANSDDMYLAEYFERLMAIEPGHFWFEARNALLIHTLKRFFPAMQQFMEIGCGTGFALHGIHRAFPNTQLTATDLLVEGLPFAASRVPTATLLQMDAREIPFQSTFDVIGSFDVLEHIEEDEAVLHQMAKALRPNGGIILTVPQHRALWSVIDEQAMHKRRYIRQELVAKVEKAGFEVLFVTSFVTLLLPMMYLSRFQYQFRPSKDGLAHLPVSSALNGIFSAVMTAEIALHRMNISLPAGGSLLLVARKR
jgi:SAM-dependent methyltransferase